MNVANLDQKLREELEALSGWKLPEHDVLIYLLRKLPPKITVKKKQYGLVLTNSTTDGSWIVDYIMFNWQQPLPEHGLEVWLHYGDKAKLTEAMEVENTAVKLCISLFQQNILQRS